MPWPDPERFEVVCYLAWGGAEVTYRLGSKEEYERVRRALDDIMGARAGGKWPASSFFPSHPGYYLIEEPDRAAFDDVMHGKRT